MHNTNVTFKQYIRIFQAEFMNMTQATMQAREQNTTINYQTPVVYHRIIMFFKNQFRKTQHVLKKNLFTVPAQRRDIFCSCACDLAWLYEHG